MNKVEIPIEGMSCGSCAARVQNALTGVPGVERADVNLLSKRATVLGSASMTEIQKAVERSGYKVGAADANEIELARRRFWLAFALGLPVFILSMFMIVFPGSAAIQALLTLAILGGPARPIFMRAFKLARHFGANMDTLVALGTGSAYLYSLWLWATGEDMHLYFESAAVIVVFVALGKFLEERSKSAASSAIRKLAELQPREVTIIQPDGSTKRAHITALKKGDLFLVASGESVATDGEIVEGESEFDESLISGESLPVLRRIGDKIVGAALNVGRGSLKVRATGVGKDTMLARIVKMVDAAQAAKPPIQKLADRVAAVFVPIVITLAILTVVAWLAITGQVSSAVMAGVAVLVIACPCALGLATPAAVVAGTGRAAQLGVLVRQPQAFELLEQAQVVVVDKTGTVTTGKPVVIEQIAMPPTLSEQFGISGESLIKFVVSAAEGASRHPVAGAIVKFLNNEIAMNLTDAKAIAQCEAVVDWSEEIAGEGIRARISVGPRKPIEEGNAPKARTFNVVVGSRQLLRRLAVRIPDTSTVAGEQRVETAVYAAVDDVFVAVYFVSDEIDAGSANAVRELKSEGLEVIMATGDREPVARHVAGKVGIDQVFAALKPSEKLELIKTMQHAGKRVVMVGDGINDAPALAVADIGIAIGSGSEAAIQTAGLVLPLGHLRQVAAGIRIGRATMKIIKQNLFWAFMYNLVAIPLAATGRLSPMIAAAAMAASSVSVVLNSLRLRRF